MAKTQTTFTKALKKVPQTYSADGLLRFGDKLMLSNKKTDSCLVVNMTERITSYEEAYACTASPNVTGPSSRSIFVIERVDENDGFEGDEIHYGQKIKFTTNSYLHHRRMFLKTTP